MASPVAKDITDIVDEFLDLPEGQEHLCSAYNDANELLEGKMRFLLNREVLDLYRDVIDAIEISRNLPGQDHPANIDIHDPLVMMIVAQDPEVKALPQDDAFQAARVKAAGFYQRQKAQVASDAMFIAMTFYNELNMVPLPYREGEIAFSTSDERQRVRSLPAWTQTKAARAFEFPLPERRLSNTYEMRLKLLYQLSETCGLNWTLNFRLMFERGLAKTLRMTEPHDDAGFPTQSVGRKVPKKSRARVEANLDKNGS